MLVKAAAAVLALDARVRPQYVELVDPKTLTAPARARDDSVMAIAAYVGNTRLIDNMSMGA
jgi:pantothenate synthetase